MSQSAAGTLSAAIGGKSIAAACVLGSGWGLAMEGVGTLVARIDYTDLAGFTASVVPGHSGRADVIELRGRRVLCLHGRTHLYEGHGVDSVVHSIRTAAELGAEEIVLTNGCGSVSPKRAPGTPVVLSDHINLTGTTPLVGAAFIDCSEIYSTRLRRIVHDVDAALEEGVYAQFRGPQYETPAEVRMAGILGADLVGMSTALEALEARRLGLEVLGLSLVTNLAAGVSPQPLDHQEVVAAGRAAAPRLQGLLAEVLSRVAGDR